MSFLKKQLRRLSFARAGIRYAVRTDKSFRLQWYGIGSIVALALYLLAPLSASEFLFIVLAYFLILITELQNSALEYALDHLHPETHDNIGRSKDMAAGAVLLAGLFLVITLGALLYIRLF
ncbi:MAG: diacylglycerol kinase [Candidatus Pacebacteria bacterium]|jgi:diacylglycerol kinase|nr:diacylglycerol kinase [Candidatus Paceibacterota bacterium]